MKGKHVEISGYGYGIIIFLIIFGFLAFVVHLGYTLILKASTNEFADTTLIQGMFTLFFTVIIGTWLTKSLEAKNAKKLELYKVMQGVSLSIVNLSSIVLSADSDEQQKKKAIDLLVDESVKVKLFFDDETLKDVNHFITEKTPASYNNLIDRLKEHLKH